MTTLTNNLLQASKSHRPGIGLSGMISRYQCSDSWFELPVNTGVRMQSLLNIICFPYSKAARKELPFFYGQKEKMKELIKKLYRRFTGRCTECGTHKVVFVDDVALCYMCDDF